MFISTVVKRIQHARHLFATDSLFRNATYLTASTAVMSLLGFLFWIFIAHLYSPSQIGVASTLISITTLISNLSLLGLNSGMVRFLPHSKDKSGDINAAAITIAGVTLLAAAAYAFIGSPLIGHVSLLTSTPHKIAFTILMVAVTLNSLTDAVFIANRRGEYHTAGYATLGSVKLILPLLLVSFGALGIFGAYILAMVASLGLSFYLMRRGCDYRFLTRPNWSIIPRTRAYNAHNYIGVVLGGLPSQLMPLVIIRDVGASYVAFFSMAWTIANLLYVIPSATMQSLLAEVSHDPHKKQEHVARTLRTLAIILIPIVALSIIVAPFMLSIFGPEYRRHATAIFQLFALMTFSVAVGTMGNTILNIERRTRGVIVAQACNVVVTFGSVVWLSRYGLPGIGLALLLGNITATIAYMIAVRRASGSEEIAQSVAPAVRPLQSGREMLVPILRQYNITDFTYKRLTNGSSNTTLLIEQPGSKYVLRIYRTRHSGDRKIEEEIGFMEYLAAQGVPVPRVLPNKQGRKLSKAAMGGTERRCILMEYIPGVHPSAYTLPMLTEMAEYQARIHLSGARYAGQRRVSGKKSLLTATLPHGFSHFDLDASNILVKGDQISTILDFEGMRYGPLIICMYFTLKDIYALEHNVSLPLTYIHDYQKVRKLHTIEKGLLAVLLSLRYRNPQFFRALAA